MAFEYYNVLQEIWYFSDNFLNGIPSPAPHLQTHVGGLPVVGEGSPMAMENPPRGITTLGYFPLQPNEA